ncbi:unnamed protein product [Ilex paraguariensis]|uniref:Uncharacterized protein n=1 Tax=Ilex paraguariensis TaxID=185542 RepID=A0ABC8RKE7_9AQUA
MYDSGQEILPNGIYTYVDVRDVAYAHVQALEIASANGRYCLVETLTYSSETRKILHKFYPTLNLLEKHRAVYAIGVIRQAEMAVGELQELKRRENTNSIPQNEPVITTWSAPPRGSIKLNYDGAFLAKTRRGPFCSGGT